MVSAERELLAGAAGRAEPRDWPLSEGLGAYVVAGAAPLVIEDARAVPELRGSGITAYAGVPLRDPDGQVLGAFAALDDEPRAWGPDALALLDDFAALAQGDLERRAAHRAAREVSALLLRLQSLSDATSTALELDPLLDAIVAGCVDTFAADVVVVDLFDRHERLERRVERGLPRNDRTVLRVGAGRRALEVQDLAVADEPGAALLREAGVRSLLAAQLLADDALRGNVYVGAREPGVFSELDRQLLAVSSERFAAAITRAERLELDHEVARTLATALQPARLPDVPGVQFAGRYEPAESGLGGDWYDAFLLPGGALGVAIGDVVGHGVGAGVEAVRLRNALRGAVLGGANVPETVLALNAHAAAQPGAFASTMVYLELDGPARRLRWASAGHLPGVIAEGGQGERLGGPGGPPLGITDPPSWPGGERTLTAGTRVALFTDGLIERRSEPLDVGIERVAAITARAPDLEALCDDAIQQAPKPRFDDLALIALELE